jgi:hypothetical protein
MHSRRSFVRFTTGFALLGGGLLAAVRGDEVMYVGGTIKAVPEKSEGHLDTSDETIAKFAAKHGSFSIPYKGISSIEYGQKAGRRVGVALAVSPIALFSKKRRHYLTLGFTDEQGNKQGAVFEVAKGRVRSVAAAFESRSGKKIDFESDEARKHFEGK